jgi:malonyl CoA-acyl carrier protein transacylase
MNINQKYIDLHLLCCSGYGNVDYAYEDCKIIQQAIKDGFGVTLSIAECYNFWHWRSEQYEASFLSVEDSQGYVSDIQEWFVDWLKETDYMHSCELFEEAEDSLRFSISELCFEGPEEALKLTENTQPAMLTASIAALRVLETEKGITPQFSAGHSLGEYSALVASGALAFPEAVRIVRLRGRFMQEAVPVGEGAMAALLGMEREQVEKICEEVSSGEVLTPANFNCPGQIVIAGHAKAVERAIDRVKKDGKKAVPLPVSAPFIHPS